MNKHVLAILLMLLPFVSHSQDFNVNWSRSIPYDRKTTGDMTEFVGANNQFVYSIFTPTYKKLGEKQRLLIAFDKVTMKQMGKLMLKSNVDFKDVCVTNEVVYVLFVDDVKGKEILYGQSYTPSLEVITSKKKIYQINTSTRSSSKSISSIKSFTNAKANDNLYLVAEKPNVKNENVEIEYNVLDKTLTPIYTGQITLPVVSTRSTAYNMSSFSIGEDGNLISKNIIKADRETRKSEKVYSYAILSVINPKEKTINSLPIKSSGKHINDFEYFTKNGKLHVAGFYKESEGKYSERGNGVFLAVLNAQSGELEDSKFSEISAPKINFGDLYLEKFKQNEDGSLSLYATEDENIVIVTTDGRGNRRTTYENRKGDILVVNLNKDGSLHWKNTITRRMTYNTLYVRDVQVIADDKDAYITYADIMKKGQKGLAAIFNRKKSRKTMRDELTYHKISIASGSMSGKTLKLNTSKTEKSKLKYVNASQIKEVNNVLYLDGFQQKIKGGVKAATCLTLPICGAGVCYLYLKLRNGSAFTGGGQLGSIKLK